MIGYNKEDWIDMKQKVKWGNNTYDLYRSPDNLYDILYIEGNLNMFISPYHSQLMFKLIIHITFQKIKKGILDKISKLILIKPNIPLNFVHTSPIERS